MSAGTYVPERGDVVWLRYDWPPVGHEQASRDRRPAVTLSPPEYNRFGLGLFCPLTTKSKGIPFEVPVPAGHAVTGVILADQVKSLDWQAREAQFECKLEMETVNEVTGRALVLIDPDGVYGGAESPPED